MSPPKLPPAIEAAAEAELDRREAEVTTKLLDDDPDRFHTGVRWLYAHLLTTASEFDEKAHERLLECSK